MGEKRQSRIPTEFSLVLEIIYEEETKELTSYMEEFNPFEKMAGSDGQNFHHINKYHDADITVEQLPDGRLQFTLAHQDIKMIEGARDGLKFYFDKAQHKLVDFKQEKKIADSKITLQLKELKAKCGFCDIERDCSLESLRGHIEWHADDSPNGSDSMEVESPASPEPEPEAKNDSPNRINFVEMESPASPEPEPEAKNDSPNRANFAEMESLAPNYISTRSPHAPDRVAVRLEMGNEAFVTTAPSLSEAKVSAAAEALHLTKYRFSQVPGALARTRQRGVELPGQAGNGQFSKDQVEAVSNENLDLLVRILGKQNEVAVAFTPHQNSMTLKIGEELYTESDSKADEAKRKATVKALLLTRYKFIKRTDGDDADTKMSKNGQYWLSAGDDDAGKHVVSCVKILAKQNQIDAKWSAFPADVGKGASKLVLGDEWYVSQDPDANRAKQQTARKALLKTSYKFAQLPEYLQIINAPWMRQSRAAHSAQLTASSSVLPEASPPESSSVDDNVTVVIGGSDAGERSVALQELLKKAPWEQNPSDLIGKVSSIQAGQARAIAAPSLHASTKDAFVERDAAPMNVVSLTAQRSPACEVEGNVLEPIHASESNPMSSAQTEAGGQWDLSPGLFSAAIAETLMNSQETSAEGNLDPAMDVAFMALSATPILIEPLPMEEDSADDDVLSCDALPLNAAANTSWSREMDEETPSDGFPLLVDDDGGWSTAPIVIVPRQLPPQEPCIQKHPQNSNASETVNVIASPEEDSGDVEMSDALHTPAADARTDVVQVEGDEDCVVLNIPKKAPAIVDLTADDDDGSGNADSDDEPQQEGSRKVCNHTFSENGQYTSFEFRPELKMEDWLKTLAAQNMLKYELNEKSVQKYVLNLGLETYELDKSHVKAKIFHDALMRTCYAFTQVPRSTELRKNRPLTGCCGKRFVVVNTSDVLGEAVNLVKKLCTQNNVQYNVVCEDGETVKVQLGKESHEVAGAENKVKALKLACLKLLQNTAYKFKMCKELPDTVSYADCRLSDFASLQKRRDAAEVGDSDSRTEMQLLMKGVQKDEKERIQKAMSKYLEQRAKKGKPQISDEEKLSQLVKKSCRCLENRIVKTIRKKSREGSTVILRSSRPQVLALRRSEPPVQVVQPAPRNSTSTNQPSSCAKLTQAPNLQNVLPEVNMYLDRRRKGQLNDQETRTAITFLKKKYLCDIVGRDIQTKIGRELSINRPTKKSAHMTRHLELTCKYIGERK